MCGADTLVRLAAWSLGSISYEMSSDANQEKHFVGARASPTIGKTAHAASSSAISVDSVFLIPAFGITRFQRQGNFGQTLS
jgi:hypothetical protein